MPFLSSNRILIKKGFVIYITERWHNYYRKEKKVADQSMAGKQLSRGGQYRYRSGDRQLLSYW